MANRSRNTFYFRLRSGRELSIAMAALTDPTLNPTRLGRIDVDAVDGFEISVFDSKRATAGHLLIRPYDFQMYFSSDRRPFEGVVNLVEMAEKIYMQEDMCDELIVFHVAGSDRITFLSTGHLSTPDGEQFRAREFHVEFQRNVPVIKRFPIIGRFFYGTLNSKDLDLITHSRREIVFCDIKCHTAILDRHSMKDVRDTLHERLYLNDPVMSQKLSYGWFRWGYYWVLQMLEALYATYTIYVVREREGNIIIRFTLERDPQGVVEFLLKTDADILQ